MKARWPTALLAKQRELLFAPPQAGSIIVAGEIIQEPPGSPAGAFQVFL